jgi:hypothetical protein
VNARHERRLSFFIENFAALSGKKIAPPCEGFREVAANARFRRSRCGRITGRDAAMEEKTYLPC